VVDKHLLRGGGGGAEEQEPVIDPELAGKLLAGVYLIQGAALVAAPVSQLKFYGMQGTTETTNALCADFGSDFLATGIVAYFSLVEKTTPKKAIGSAFLFLFGWTLCTLLADRQASIGANNAPIFARLVVFGLGVASTLFYDNANKDPGEKDS
jgi:hypothetical protein